MAEANPPLYVPAQQIYGPDELSLPFRDIVAEGVTGISTELQVTQRAAGANKSVDVAGGACFVHGDENVAEQGAYRCRNNGITNLAVSDNTSGNPRVDRVVAEVLDSTFAGSSNLWRLRVVQGVPGGAPVAPVTPSNAISLATVAVANNFTSIVNANITDTRLRAVPLRGGEILYAEQTGSVTVTATTEATATTVVTALPATFDGSPVYVEFAAAVVEVAAVAGATLEVGLSLDGVGVGRLAYFRNPAAAALLAPAFGRRRITPAGGTRTFSVRAFQSGGNGVVHAGTSGPGLNTPALLRVTRA